MSHPIGTEKSYEVFQRRRRDGELSTPQLDSTNRRLYSMVGSAYKTRKFIADPDMDDAGDAACPNPPTRASVGFDAKDEGR